ncbi:MAG TPA: hypothetical protein VKO18_18130 [Terriglobia bacterium]|nr:hypothetical protein [Terriglobia bacterium]
MRLFIVLAVLSGGLGVWAMLYAQDTPQSDQLPDTRVPPPPFGRTGSGRRSSPPNTHAPEEQAKEKPHFNTARAHKDAQELAELAQAIPAQVDEVSKSIMPKDLVQQLKQIEKLAKRLRSEINP